MTKKNSSIHRLSVIVPENPFTPPELKDKQQCLCALDVENLIKWWPGTPHEPHRNPIKVKNIQRSLDWKRVAQIAAYLLQEEIHDTGEKINKYFKNIYEPKRYDPGREWPPRVSKITGYEKSEFRVFSNILLHVNGAHIEMKNVTGADEKAAQLTFDDSDKNLNFFVIDGQHRINGAFFALRILQESKPKAVWKIPAQIFLDLDPKDGPPKIQAQIFIDVNFYQKKVDRSLVADLFPTVRAGRDSLDNKERAQDIGRKLMLEIGPLVGMIQIPGIKFGVKDVVTLATLNSAIEDILDYLASNNVESFNNQTEFIAQCLSAWLEATGRIEVLSKDDANILDSENVVYQGRILVSVISLMPAIIWKIIEERAVPNSLNSFEILKNWFKQIIKRAGLETDGKFITKSEFKELGYLGSGGIARFRDALWASIRGTERIGDLDSEEVSNKAEKNKKFVKTSLSSYKKK